MEEPSLLGAIFSLRTILLGIIIGCVYSLYRISLGPTQYFIDRGIPYRKGWPFLGSLTKLLLRQESFFDLALKPYMEFKDYKIYGILDTMKTVIALRDPELIKKISIKDFDYFEDRRTYISENEPLFGKSLVMLRGQRWRDMRGTLSPVFTGSKMRQMFHLIAECSDNATQNLLAKAKSSSNLEPIDMKDIFTRFTSDVIATCAFGIKVNSLEHPNNGFYLMGKNTTDLGGVVPTIKFIITAMLPSVAKWLGIRYFVIGQSKYYHDLVHGTIKAREEQGIIRPDMIHLLMQARKGTLKQEVGSGDGAGFATVEEAKSEELRGSVKQVWDDDDVTAMCFQFFVAGFETSSSLLCYAAHELMVNPDIQRRLIEEFDEVKEQLNGKKITYDILMKLTYLDMVVSETLRKWPPAMSVDRECTKPYAMDGNDGRKIKIRVGDGLWIPILGLHRDPDYFPEPLRFDPERFSDERKDSIVSGTYLPFGIGPRNCIGSRFALMECKAYIYYLLTNFTFEVAPNSEIPPRMANAGFSSRVINGFNMYLKPRF